MNEQLNFNNTAIYLWHRPEAQGRKIIQRWSEPDDAIAHSLPLTAQEGNHLKNRSGHAVFPEFGKHVRPWRCCRLDDGQYELRVLVPLE